MNKERIIATDDLNYIYLSIEKNIVEFDFYTYIRSELHNPELTKDESNLKQVLLESLFNNIFRALYTVLLDSNKDSMAQSKELEKILKKYGLFDERKELGYYFTKYRNGGLCHRISYKKLAEYPEKYFEVNNEDLGTLMRFVKNFRKTLLNHFKPGDVPYMTLISYNENQLHNTMASFFLN